MARVFILLASVLSIVNCATFISGSEYTINVISEPDNADVVARVDSYNVIIAKSKTNGQIVIDYSEMPVTNKRVILDFTKKGYIRNRVVIEPELNKLSCISFGFFFWPGIVDLLTGSLYKPRITTAQVILEKKEETKDDKTSNATVNFGKYTHAGALKNGKGYNYVKSHLTSKNVVIHTRSGQKIVLQKSAVKSLKKR